MFNVLFSLAKDQSSSGTPISSPASSSREGLITTVYKLYHAQNRMRQPYQRIKNALKKMQDDYMESKERNILVRYSHMQKMVHEVVLLEKQYWQLIDIPNQDISETPNCYVLRVMNMLDETGSVGPKAGGIASLLASSIKIAEKTKDESLFEKIRSQSTEQLRRECDLLFTDLFKLIRKYLSLRVVVHELAISYQRTAYLPIVPKFLFLKSMIKRVLRAPAFAEICHETTD
ncbi:hypothetical protein M3Y98_00215800 [Aphelenchoides besseyi]|nr:hypothetical protein M3Y98_00215800 [Aphelenchoides besseyi]